MKKSTAVVLMVAVVASVCLTPLAKADLSDNPSLVASPNAVYCYLTYSGYNGGISEIMGGVVATSMAYSITTYAGTAWVAALGPIGFGIAVGSLAVIAGM
jgi:hypothetical protein